MDQTRQKTSYAIGEVARLAGVTVRTLHHYDHIGLLSPGKRSEGGYRCYVAADLERLHRILSYRALGLPLDDIVALLDDPEVDPVAHLDRQERLLRDRIGRLEELLAAVQTAKEAHQMGIDLTPEERFELFGDFDPNDHGEEADRRWGGTEAFPESQHRTGSYSKEQWRAVMADQERVASDMAAAMTDGLAADDTRAMDLAEAHRTLISKCFYDCSYEIHRGLGDIYVADPRFTAHYEDIAPGLAQYVRDAIHANSNRAGTSARQRQE